MSHFGVLSIQGTGHLNPMIALSRQLVARGHRVTFFLPFEMKERILEAGLEFSEVRGLVKDNRSKSRQKRPLGLADLRFRISRIIGEMESSLREAPEAMIRAGVEALILDEIVLSGPTLAEILRVPYYIISTSIPHNFGWSAPRRITPPQSWFSIVKKAFVEISIFRMRGPVRWRLDRYRRRVGLGPVRERSSVYPELAHITQLPQSLDFSRTKLPRNFYYTGPFVDGTGRSSVDFPWDRLDGRPLVYASLGTTLKGELSTYRLIAEACSGPEIQLVISLGGRRDPEVFQGLPGRPLVVRNAPQLELLRLAHIVITHAGPNTVFETLLQGKPMIALPKCFDQPAIAARLEWLGVAEVLRLKDLTALHLRNAVMRILNDPKYRFAAQKLQKEILSAHGLKRATDIIEETLKSRG
jgi:zeaxanthin glucosyltransferase|nr:nucleotide disphospho-sugar-binding domain-containing protein [Terracidiphilus gabretensis]